jgi:Icc-related predicted phosphoesterase
MRILAFSDLHRRWDRAARVVEKAAASEVDLVIGAGDFSSLGRGLGRMIGILRAIDAPTVLVAGNHESPDGLTRACRGWSGASVLHGEGLSIGGLAVWGIGGAVPPTPFPWGFDLREQDAERLLAGCPPGGVLVSHSPPARALDRAHGRHLGSHAVRAAIERAQPRLVVCGHIHQCAGQEATIGSTRVLNAGPYGTLLRL